MMSACETSMKMPISGEANRQTITLMKMQKSAEVRPALRMPLRMRSLWPAP